MDPDLDKTHSAKLKLLLKTIAHTLEKDASCISALKDKCCEALNDDINDTLLVKIFQKCTKVFPFCMSIL